MGITQVLDASAARYSPNRLDEDRLGVETVASFAGNVLRILDGAAFVIAPKQRSRAGRAPLAVAGAQDKVERLLDEMGWSPVPPGDRGFDCPGATIERNEQGATRISSTPYGNGEDAVVVRLLASHSRQPDARQARMVTVAAEMATLYVTPEGDMKPPSNLSETSLLIAKVLSDIALTADSYNEMVGGITAAVCPLVRAETGGVGLWNDGECFIQMLSGSFGVRPEFVASSQAAISDAGSPAAQVVISSRPWFTNSALTDMPQKRNFLLGLGIKRLAIMPLTFRGRTIGVMHIANKREPFDDGDVRRLEVLTPFVASAVEHVHRRLELGRREAVASVVSQAATTIARGQPLSGPPFSLARFCESVGGRLLSVSFTDGAPPIVVGPRNVPNQLAKRFRADNANGGIATRSATKRPREAGDIGWDSLHVPIMLGGNRAGTLSILRTPSEPFSENERAAVVRLGNVIALAWATERYQQERARMARIQERQRIGDDLHDHVAQILFSAQLTLETVVRELDDDTPLLGPIVRARELLVRSELGIREVVQKLTSPNSTDIVARLEQVVQGIEEDFDVQIHFEAEAGIGEQIEGIQRTVADAILGAAREAMINAAKHAGPCRISVALNVSQRRRLRVIVVDDGIGPKAERRQGYGLWSHRRRVQMQGGTVRMSKQPYGGTKVVISMRLSGATTAID
jgi:signal transduction histidine kinase